MTRVTAPIAKLTRSLSTTASAPRPSHLLNASKTASARVRQELEQTVDGRSSDTSSTTRGITTSHRPVPSPTRTIPLMQTFHSSPGQSARLDTSSIDYAVLPSTAQLYGDNAAADSFARMRVPLLPDNYNPDRSHLVAEEPDAPLAEPEIRIVAADPAKVLPAALTEVEGFGVDGVELKWAHEAEPAAGAQHAEGGMLRDLWKGLVDDVFGENKAKPAL
ncbi:hypothetical protein UCRPA7_1712 [Phaeoacremonium minimum UCRPA7]|uniref:Uncharacterized protein n=1 Tax=Phaeoacremonium minimum (strain UCR-PA7) TaxID=1286976 RepID=R8BTT1_PHAM7|nr:hypothetical protein UCRPA7_1712 [Phaeoacremonium minimum UCRPA7]EOO02777.1 hypothetical protein UCRPA7_1712 [Phaeoacremonium minimum UCRPA7]